MKYTQAKGVWEQDLSFRSSLRDAIDEITRGIGFSESYLSGVEKLAKDAFLRMDWDGFTQEESGKRSRIAFKNGVLDVDAKKLLPHARENYCTRKLSYDYDPSATCEPIINFLKESTDPAGVKKCLAFAALALRGNLGIQKFFVITGFGGTGKSTYLNVLYELAATDLKSLESPYEAANFCGANILAVPDSDRVGNGAIIKRITGGDWLRRERKLVQYMPPFVFDGVVAIITNELDLMDKTSGLYRRQVQIIFNNIPKLKDLDLEKKLKASLPGFANLVLTR